MKPGQARVTLLCTALALGGCTTVPRVPPAPAKSVRGIIAAIHAAGQRDHSVVEVTPLRDPAVKLLLQRLRSAVVKGHDQHAAQILAQAHGLAPTDPKIVQLQAEVAIRMHRYGAAERLARQSYALGSKSGSLCARNWQTVVEVRRVAKDPAAVAAAKQSRDQCQLEGIKRM